MNSRCISISEKSESVCVCVGMLWEWVSPVLEGFSF